MAVCRHFIASNPRATEAFLLTHPDVLDASVWMTDGRLLAHVTVHDDSALSPGALRLACAEELGLHLTPAEIVLMSARRRAA